MLREDTEQGPDDCQMATLEPGSFRGDRLSLVREIVVIRHPTKRTGAQRTSPDLAGRVAQFRRNEAIFSQGDDARSILYIQKGGVKVTVVNKAGKEAIVAILGPGDFLGESCLAGQPLRVGTAAAMTPCTAFVIQKKEMARVLHAQHAFSDRFIAYMLARNIQIEEDLVDQFFNHSEKRLARTLLLLARYGKEDQPHRVLHKVSQQMLAGIIGTTQSRIKFFMNKFQKLGFIKYDGGLHVHNSLLSVVLHE